MNLRHFRTFVAIADAGGVARAAVRLNLSQPAASRHVCALERELGVPLFDRVGRRVQLTSEGEDLLRRCRILLADIDSIGERARALKGGQVGMLRVGAPPHVIETLLADFLRHYRRRHPGVEVHLVEDGGARLAGRLERGDVHLTFMPAGDARFHGRLLFPIHLIAALSGTHKLARRAVLEIAELTEHPVLLLRREFGSRSWFDTACQLAHIRPRVLLESAAPQTLLALAAAEYGVAVLPSNLRLARGTLRAIPLIHRGASIGNWAMIAWDPQRLLAPYAEQFITELAASLKRTYPGRDLIRRAPPLPRPKEPES